MVQFDGMAFTMGPTVVAPHNTGMPPRMITIKKYSNRRLYDTSASEYITLEELAEKIREGHDVEVVEASSGKEITQRVLAQIILESRGAARMLPVPLLLRLIRMGDDRLTEFFGQFMSWSLEMYLQFKEGAESVYGPFAKLPGPAGEWMRTMFERGPGAENDVPDISDSESGEPAPPGTSRSDLSPSDMEPPGSDADNEDRQSLAEMRKELDELKSIVKKVADERIEDDEDGD